MKWTHVEYGVEETTMVYLVDDETREDLIAVPVLFKENKAVMGEILSHTV